MRSPTDHTDNAATHAGSPPSGLINTLQERLGANGPADRILKRRVWSKTPIAMQLRHSSQADGSIWRTGTSAICQQPVQAVSAACVSKSALLRGVRWQIVHHRSAVAITHTPSAETTVARSRAETLLARVHSTKSNTIVDRAPAALTLTALLDALKNSIMRISGRSDLLGRRTSLGRLINRQFSMKWLGRGSCRLVTSRNEDLDVTSVAPPLRRGNR